MVTENGLREGKGKGKGKMEGIEGGIEEGDQQKKTHFPPSEGGGPLCRVLARLDLLENDTV
jgi:hypothetical protein